LLYCIYWVVTVDRHEMSIVCEQFLEVSRTCWFWFGLQVGFSSVRFSFIHSFISNQAAWYVLWRSMQNWTVRAWKHSNQTQKHKDKH